MVSDCNIKNINLLLNHSVFAKTLCVVVQDLPKWRRCYSWNEFQIHCQLLTSLPTVFLWWLKTCAWIPWNYSWTKSLVNNTLPKALVSAKVMFSSLLELIIQKSMKGILKGGSIFPYMVDYRFPVNYSFSVLSFPFLLN